jgi:hypothetical protein
MDWMVPHLERAGRLILPADDVAVVADAQTNGTNRKCNLNQAPKVSIRSTPLPLADTN